MPPIFKTSSILPINNNLDTKVASILIYTVLAFILDGKYVLGLDVKWHEEKNSHQGKTLTPDQLRKLSIATAEKTFASILDPILVKRDNGSPGYAQSIAFIKTHMTDLGWTVESDVFKDQTPSGQKSFENIIATLDPKVPRRLVLACHFDSKVFPGRNFIGATDSAVPCAMLIHLAHVLKQSLAAHKVSAGQKVTLQFVFFDGEEAFRPDWSGLDNTYGSRHLAELWEKTKYPDGSKSSKKKKRALQTNETITPLISAKQAGGTNMLHRMDVLVLLDLIGTSSPRFQSSDINTFRWYGFLVEAEKFLRKTPDLWSGNPKSGVFFQNIQVLPTIQDDHVPFMNRGVRIVHLIANPFPSVWHTDRDDRNVLDFLTIDNLNKIFRIFVARYLHLNV